jgi:hypothetical protein
MTTRRVDVTTLAAWTEQVARVFPHAARSEQAWYLQSVTAWPGLDLPDRAFWLTVWDVWGQTTAAWHDVVWQVRQATAAAPSGAPVAETPS